MRSTPLYRCAHRYGFAECGLEELHALCDGEVQKHVFMKENGFYEHAHRCVEHGVKVFLLEQFVPQQKRVLQSKNVGVESGQHGGDETRDERLVGVGEEYAKAGILLETLETHEIAYRHDDVHCRSVFAVERVHRQHDAHETLQRVEGVLHRCFGVIVVKDVEERKHQVVQTLRVPETLVDGGKGVEYGNKRIAMGFEPRVIGGATNIEADLLVVGADLELERGVGRGGT